MVFLILIVVSFFVLEILFYSKQLKKLQLKLSRSTIAIYPYEKPLLTVSQVLTEINLADTDTLLASKMKTSINFWHLLLGDVQLGTLEIKTEWYNSYKKEM
jgi:hypothetical protein